MATTNVHELGDVQLLEFLNDERDRLFKLRFQLATGQLENNARIREVKRDIARLMTELRSREIRAAESLGVEAR